jgi:hypothetical protein
LDLGGDQLVRPRRRRVFRRGVAPYLPSWTSSSGGYPSHNGRAGSVGSRARMLSDAEGKDSPPAEPPLPETHKSQHQKNWRGGAQSAHPCVSSSNASRPAFTCHAHRLHRHLRLLRASALLLRARAPPHVATQGSSRSKPAPTTGAAVAWSIV